MPKSKHLWVGLSGVVIVLLLCLVLVLKDNAKIISAAALENALQKNFIIKLWERDDYLMPKPKIAKCIKSYSLKSIPPLSKQCPLIKQARNGLFGGL